MVSAFTALCPSTGKAPAFFYALILPRPLLTPITPANEKATGRPVALPYLARPQRSVYSGILLKFGLWITWREAQDCC